jgi:hypothetical protein
MKAQRIDWDQIMFYTMLLLTVGLFAAIALAPNDTDTKQPAAAAAAAGQIK